MKTLTHPGSAIVVLVLAAIAFTACGSETEPGSGEPRTVELTEQDAGSSISMNVGDELVVTLESNITTGFAWSLTTEPAAEVLDLVDSEYLEPDSDLVGAGGQEVWTFVATGGGTTELELSYERSSGETSGQTFAVTVEVTG